MEQGLPPCQCHLQEPPGAHSPRPDGLIGASRPNPMPPRWYLSCLLNAMEMEGDREKKTTKDFVSSASPTHVLAWVLLCLHLKAAGAKAPRPPLPLLSASCPSELRFPKLLKVSGSWFSLQGRCWLPGQPQSHSLLPQRARRMLADTQGSRGVTQESCWYFPLPEHHWFVKGTAFPGQILLPAV